MNGMFRSADFCLLILAYSRPIVRLELTGITIRIVFASVGIHLTRALGMVRELCKHMQALEGAGYILPLIYRLAQELFLVKIRDLGVSISRSSDVINTKVLLFLVKRARLRFSWPGTLSTTDSFNW